MLFEHRNIVALIDFLRFLGFYWRFDLVKVFFLIIGSTSGIRFSQKENLINLTLLAWCSSFNIYVKGRGLLWNFQGHAHQFNFNPNSVYHSAELFNFKFKSFRQVHGFNLILFLQIFLLLNLSSPPTNTIMKLIKFHWK